MYPFVFVDASAIVSILFSVATLATNSLVRHDGRIDNVLGLPAPLAIAQDFHLGIMAAYSTRSIVPRDPTATALGSCDAAQQESTGVTLQLRVTSDLSAIQEADELLLDSPAIN